MSQEYEMYSVRNIVNKYAISLYGDTLTRFTMLISLKCIEILNHCVAHQNLTVLKVNYIF